VSALDGSVEDAATERGRVAGDGAVDDPQAGEEVKAAVTDSAADSVELTGINLIANDGHVADSQRLLVVVDAAAGLPYGRQADSVFSETIRDGQARNEHGDGSGAETVNGENSAIGVAVHGQSAWSRPKNGDGVGYGNFPRRQQDLAGDASCINDVGHVRVADGSAQRAGTAVRGVADGNHYRERRRWPGGRADGNDRGDRESPPQLRSEESETRDDFDLARDSDTELVDWCRDMQHHGQESGRWALG